mgnify:CR=1 FL=1
MRILFKSIIITSVLFSQALHCAKTIPNILKKNNFSWIADGVIAGMAMPKTNEQIKALHDLNIGLVVTLTESEEGPASEIFKNVDIERFFLPISDGVIPTVDQVNKFIEKSKEVWDKTGKATVVHCRLGKGRTGTMLACWLLANTDMRPDAAIKFVRKKRPGSIESIDQEIFVEKYYSYLILKRNNFSWIVDGVIAGMSIPKTNGQIRALNDLNIGLVVTLTEQEEGPDLEIFNSVSIERLILSIPDFGVPTIDQVDKFIEKSKKILKSKGKATVVHCWGGKGRTGTMLACWLLANKNMKSVAAINLVRAKRPGSIETDEQIKFVGKYYNILLNRKLKKLKRVDKKIRQLTGDLAEVPSDSILVEKLKDAKQLSKSRKSKKQIEKSEELGEFYEGIEQEQQINSLREKLSILHEILVSFKEKLSVLQQKLLILKTKLLIK